jgi:uncharacterized protein YcbK (DUF882 family)
MKAAAFALVPIMALVPNSATPQPGLREDPDPMASDRPAIDELERMTMAIGLPEHEGDGPQLMSEMKVSTDVTDVPKPVHVTLYTVNEPHETLEIDLPVDGMVTTEQDQELKHFFRFHPNGREKSIAPGELALLADVGQHWPGQVIEIVSGFRTPPYGVPHSKHFKGHAIDLRVRGVKLTEVRDTMWREHHGIGLGYYPEQGFVHVDDRDGIPEAAWTSAYEGAEYQYHPYWAERARDPERQQKRLAGGGTHNAR